MSTILSLIPIMLIPSLIVWFWRKRPVLALSLAIMVLLISSVLPGILKSFQLMAIYGEGDPQLMAGAISQILVSMTLSLIILTPLLVLIQVIGRRSDKKKVSKETVKDTFS